VARVIPAQEIRIGVFWGSHGSVAIRNGIADLRSFSFIGIFYKFVDRVGTPLDGTVVVGNEATFLSEDTAIIIGRGFHPGAIGFKSAAVGGWVFSFEQCFIIEIRALDDTAGDA
jgi:hypothetical protein